MVHLDVDQAVVILEALGCASDPVKYKDKWMQAEDLSYEVSDLTSARKVRITYYPMQGGTRCGTLSGMVADRLEVRQP